MCGNAGFSKNSVKMATETGENAGYMRASAVRWLFVVVLCLECCVNCVWGGTTSAPMPVTISTPNCSAVAHLFELRRINSADIPREPKHEMLLKYCEIPETGTCCTYEIENRLATSSKLQLERTTKDSIGKLSSVLATRAHKFNEFFKELLSESKREFDLMFKRTYGVIYEQNSYVFADLFTELENYYARGKVDLSEAMDSFFNVLYQKMFTVLNSQYKFDDKYLGCVSEHMKELKPFGDVPDKLSVQVKRSFVATRTYAQALSTAADVAKNMVNVRPNADCTAALMKMQQCNLCKGHPEKPCANYCVNVMKGCLQYYHDLDIEWDNFVSSMEKVSERLLGPFNIVMVVEPINIKISEAIMNFQETGQGISTQVFQGCGRPVLSLRRRSINPKFVEPNNVKPSSSFSDIVDDAEPGILDIDADIDEAEILSDRVRRSSDISSQELHYDQVEFPSSDEQAGQSQRGRKKNKKNQQGKKNNNNNNNNNNDDEDYNKEPHLDKLVKDIRQKVKDSKKFWSNLPYQICNNEELAAPPSPDANCWNGSTVDRYSHAIANDQTLNPEFPSSQSASSTRQSSILANQIFSLRTVVSNLRNAYNGYDVEWSDQEEPYYGSGSGSGGGIDDEDDVSSGLGSIEESIVHSRGETGREHGHHDPTSRSHPSGGTTRSETLYPKHNVPTTHSAGGTVTHSDHKPKESGSSSRVKNVMSLRRALITYLFPIYMAWFGGIISDLL